MKKVDRTTGRLGIRQRERWLKDYGELYVRLDIRKEKRTCNNW